MHSFINIPLGTLAGAAIRDARKRTKQPFESLYTSGRLTRSEAYLWLAEKHVIAHAAFHFGWFDVDMCLKAGRETCEIFFEIYRSLILCTVASPTFRETLKLKRVYGCRGLNMCKDTFNKTLSEANNNAGLFMPAWVMDELIKHIPSGVMKWVENQCLSFGHQEEYRLESVRNRPPKGACELTCPQCGGDNVVKDAFASWDVNAQEFVLHSTYDESYCQDCDESVSPSESPLGTDEESE